MAPSSRVQPPSSLSLKTNMKVESKGKREDFVSGSCWCSSDKLSWFHEGKQSILRAKRGRGQNVITEPICHLLAKIWHFISIFVSAFLMQINLQSSLNFIFIHSYQVAVCERWQAHRRGNPAPRYPDGRCQRGLNSIHINLLPSRGEIHFVQVQTHSNTAPPKKWPVCSKFAFFFGIPNIKQKIHTHISWNYQQTHLKSINSNWSKTVSSPEPLPPATSLVPH